jgi:hypothetical protein
MFFVTTEPPSIHHVVAPKNHLVTTQKPSKNTHFSQTPLKNTT